MRATLEFAVACAVLLMSACGERHSGPAPAHAALGGGAVARVGNVDIPVTLLAGVATAQHVKPATALDRLVEDALAASGATARALDRTADVHVAEVAALGRATLRQIDAEAHKTPPTDDEVLRMSEENWVVVDAPATFTVIHAIVMRPDPPSPALIAQAKALAASIAHAEADTTTAADFETAAKALPHPNLKVVVETLPPLTADGRIAVTGMQTTFDATFSAAAAALPAPGWTSGVVETSFGWHVIRLLERSAPRNVPFDERRRLFAEEIYTRRAHGAMSALEKQRTASEGVALANGVDDLLSEASKYTRADAP